MAEGPAAEAVVPVTHYWARCCYSELLFFSCALRALLLNREILSSVYESERECSQGLLEKRFPRDHRIRQSRTHSIHTRPVPHCLLSNNCSLPVLEVITVSNVKVTSVPRGGEHLVPSII